MLLPAKLKTYLRRQLALLPHPRLSPPLALRCKSIQIHPNRVTSTQNQRTPAFTIQRLALPTKVCDHSNQCKSKEWQLMQASIHQFTYSNVNGRSWSVLFSVPSASTEGVFWEWSSSCDSTTDWNSWSIQWANQLSTSSSMSSRSESSTWFSPLWQLSRHEKETTASFRPPRRFAQAVPRGLGKVVDVQKKKIMVKPSLRKFVQRKFSREPGLHVLSLEKLANRD